MPNNKNKTERRVYINPEIRVITDDDKIPKIVGHAAVFDKLSVDLWGFKEKIAKGTFLNTIKNDDIRALWNHNNDYVLGRNKNGTLILKEDDIGLHSITIPPGTTWAQDHLVSIDRGDVTGMSFGFMTIIEEWDETDKKNPIRTLKEVKLFDVSPVTFPAYPDTDVQVRSIIGDYGIDYDVISKILIRKRYNIEISEEDKIEINSIINKLNEILIEPTLINDSTIEKPMLSIDLLRKSLDLKLKTIKKGDF